MSQRLLAMSTAATPMPEWLKTVLLAVGLLIGAAFLMRPVLAAGRRRRSARFVVADHDRLVVTLSESDGTVYVLRPPGEDPRTVLRAARPVLPKGTRKALAAELGVPLAAHRVQRPAP